MESFKERREILGDTKESIMEVKHLNTNNVASVLATQRILGHMKESILERNLMNAHIAASGLAKKGL